MNNTTKPAGDNPPDLPTNADQPPTIYTSQRQRIATLQDDLTLLRELVREYVPIGAIIARPNYARAMGGVL